MKKLITTALAFILCAAMTITAGLQLASAAEIPDPPVPTDRRTRTRAARPRRSRMGTSCRTGNRMGFNYESFRVSGVCRSL